MLRGLDPDTAVAEALAEVGPELGGLALAVLVASNGSVRLTRSAGFAAGDDERLGSWAAGMPDLAERPLLRDDVQGEPGLHGVSDAQGSPLGPLQAQPLRFRGHSLGTLVAVGPAGKELSERQRGAVKLEAARLVTALVAARASQRLDSDVATGLPGVKELHATLDAELDRCRRYGQRIAVVLLELERIAGSVPGPGDRLPRDAGDEIARICRISDFPFHLAGDKFALILPQGTEAGAERMAERLDQVVRMLPGAEGLSSGVAIFRAHGEGKDELLLHADNELRRARGAVAEATAPEEPPAPVPEPAAAEAAPPPPAPPVTRRPPAPAPVPIAPAEPVDTTPLPGIDYYAALRVDRGASAAQITHAYRDLSYRHRTAHREGNSRAEERFKVVSQAYRVLGDPDTRARYDREFPAPPQRERRISGVLRRPQTPDALAREARRTVARLPSDNAECSTGDVQRIAKLLDAAREAVPDDPEVARAWVRVSPQVRYRDGFSHTAARETLESLAAALEG